VWADNETDLDLLGFDELVDELVVALTTPALLPLTVGVLGDWGSGKSSLLRITRRELEAETEDGEEQDDAQGLSPYLCVDFSPWLYEDYEDVKTALMRQVLDACRTRATTPDAVQATERLGRFARFLGRSSRTAGRMALTAAPAVLPYALGAAGVDMGDATSEAVQSAAEAVAPLAANTLTNGPAAASVPDPILDLSAFREEFRKLIESLDGVRAVVVFVDDLDRCLPETVVDTFEAIRLFLNSPQTAYVVAASREIVETAIDSRYPSLTREDGRGIGHDYLEKMLQLQVSVPPLSPGQTESYINLLITQLHLPAGDFDAVRESLRERQRSDPFAPTFNAATARQTLGDRLTVEISADLDWTGEISEVLGFLRGNPRQVKRFLNELTWRRRAAARRRVDLRHDVLAKLMVLEEQNAADFQTLFDWHQRVGGPAPELAAAETQACSPEAAAPADDATPAQRPPARTGRRAAAGSDDPAPQNAPAEPDPVAEAAASWLARPKTRAWLRLSPTLSGIDLRPYFSYFRDRLIIGSATANLPLRLQLLLSDLLSEASAQVRAALDACQQLGEAEQELLVEALMDTVTRRPDGPGFHSACEFAGRVHRTAPAICEVLTAIPHRALAARLIPGAVRRLAGSPGSAELIAGWAASTVTSVSRYAAAASKPRVGA